MANCRMRAEAHVIIPGEKNQFLVHFLFLATPLTTFSQPLVERCAVEPDLDGCAVPRAWAGEGLRRRGRRREGDGARGAQEAPGRQPRQRGVHERVPLRHSVEQLEGAEKTRQIDDKGAGVAAAGWLGPPVSDRVVGLTTLLPPAAFSAARRGFASHIRPPLLLVSSIAARARSLTATEASGREAARGTWDIDARNPIRRRRGAGQR
jgi:hypothetical protein